MQYQSSNVQFSGPNIKTSFYTYWLKHVNKRVRNKIQKYIINFLNPLYSSHLRESWLRLKFHEPLFLPQVHLPSLTLWRDWLVWHLGIRHFFTFSPSFASILSDFSPFSGFHFLFRFSDLKGLFFIHYSFSPFSYFRFLLKFSSLKLFFTNNNFSYFSKFDVLLQFFLFDFLTDTSFFYTHFLR